MSSRCGVNPNQAVDHQLNQPQRNRYNRGDLKIYLSPFASVHLGNRRACLRMTCFNPFLLIFAACSSLLCDGCKLVICQSLWVHITQITQRKQVLEAVQSLLRGGIAFHMIGGNFGPTCPIGRGYLQKVTSLGIYIEIQLKITLLSDTLVCSHCSNNSYYNI